MKNNSLKLLISILFLGHLPLYSMKTLKSLKPRHAFTMFGVGLVAEHYVQKHASYKDFLEIKKQEEINAKISYSKKLADDLKIETKVEFIRFRKAYDGRKQLKPENSIRELSHIWFTVKEQENLCECYVDHLETDYQHRNKGYATLLLHDLEDEMQKSSCLKIALSAVNEKIPFYEKRGFRINKLRHSGYGDCTVMEKELAEIK